MKLFQYVISAVILASIAFSCSSVKTIPITETIAISKYKAYVFRLCEFRNSFGNIRYFLCDENCEETNVQANDSIQVIEELYLFVSTINPEDVIYITSKSDKYIQRNRGIFNDPLYKKHIMVSDFEYVYFGKLNNTKMKFVNPTEKLTFDLKNTSEKCSLQFETIYSQTAVKNTIRDKYLAMADLFSVDIQFIETERELVFSKKDLEPINNLVLKEGEMIFESANNKYSISQRRRLKYHPIYGPTHDSIVKRIVRDSIENQVLLRGKAL